MNHMSELENKFIMMSRIAVALGRKGFTCSLQSHPDFCSMNVHSGSDFIVVESINSYDCTEAELLEWWAIIEG